MKLFKAWALADWQGAKEVPMQFFINRASSSPEDARAVVIGFDDLTPEYAVLVTQGVDGLFREDEAEHLRRGIAGVMIQEVMFPCHYGDVWPITVGRPIIAPIGAGLKEFDLPFELWVACYVDDMLKPETTAEHRRSLCVNIS